MNRQNPFASSNFFKPASHYLGSATSTSAASHRRSLSLDDLDSDAEAGRTNFKAMESSEASQSSYLSPAQSSGPTAFPLVDVSRSPSPFARNRSAVQSEDEDEFEGAEVAQSRPLVDKGRHVYSRTSAKQVLRRGGLGQFLFGTGIGSKIYIGLLVFWVGGCQFGLLLINRFIFWTGTYKFPYPLTMTLIQLIITHLLILGFASLTRGLSRPLNKLGLGYVVAPSEAYTRGSRPTRYRGGLRHKSAWANIMRWLTHGSGGVAGGGLFEWQWQTAKHLLPVAVVFTAKIVLSNLSYAYAVLPMYMLSRIAIIPLTLLFTTLLMQQSHSVPTLSSALTATLNLLVASIRPGERVTWESVVSGIFSSLFAALYPILLLRAYKRLVSDLVPQGDLLLASEPMSSEDSSSSSSSSSSPPAAAAAFTSVSASVSATTQPQSQPQHQPPATSIGTKEETRAYWRTLHYTSLMTIALLTPLVLLSGEPRQIHRNCYFLDVPWFWFLVVCSSLGSWAVFCATLLLIKATSPLTAQMVTLPRSAFQLVVLNKFRLPAHSWVGVAICWLGCLWYLIVRAREGRLRFFGIEAR